VEQIPTLSTIPTTALADVRDLKAIKGEVDVRTHQAIRMEALRRGMTIGELLDHTFEHLWPEPTISTGTFPSAGGPE
jgi:hypothetical protein